MLLTMEIQNEFSKNIKPRMAVSVAAMNRGRMWGFHCITGRTGSAGKVWMHLGENFPSCQYLKIQEKLHL